MGNHLCARWVLLLLCLSVAACSRDSVSLQPTILPVQSPTIFAVQPAAILPAQPTIRPAQPTRVPTVTQIPDPVQQGYPGVPRYPQSKSFAVEYGYEGWCADCTAVPVPAYDVRVTTSKSRDSYAMILEWYMTILPPLGWTIDFSDDQGVDMVYTTNGITYTGSIFLYGLEGDITIQVQELISDPWTWK